MMRVVIFPGLIALGLLFVSCLPLMAERTDETPLVTLEPLTVEEKKSVSAEQNVEQVDVKSERSAIVSRIPDVIDQVPGVDVQGRGVLTPKSSQVRLRGLDERRSLILLDGRPLNGTGVMGGYFVDWSMLAVEDFERVDVGKGAFSARYGNTLGGVINLVPARPSEKPEVLFETGYKRYDTFSSFLSGSARSQNFGARVLAGYASTDGNLRNSEVERANFSGNFYYFFGGDGEIRFGIRYTEGDFNMPVENVEGAPGYDPDYPENAGSYLAGPGIQFPSGDTFGDGSYYEKKRTEMDLSFRKELLGFQSELKVYRNYEERKDVFYSYNTGEKVLVRDCVPDRSWGWVIRLGRYLADHHVTFGADANYQGYEGTNNTFIRANYFTRNPTDGSNELDATRYHGLYVDDTWKVTEWLTLYGGLRYEDYYGNRSVDVVTGYQNGRPAGFETTTAEFDESTLLPKFGVTVTPRRWLTIFGHAGRATRFPDNPAFYWYYGGYRPEVDPSVNIQRKPLTYEDAVQYEVGTRITPLEGVSLGFTWFDYRIDDYIRWIFGYSPSRVVYNVDRVNIHGVEMDGRIRLGGGFSGFFNVTWQDTEKKGDVLDASNALTDKLSEIPEWKFNIGLSYERENGLLAKVTLRWVDDRQVPYLNGGSPDGTPLGTPVTLRSMDSFAVVDLLVRYPLTYGPFQGYISAGVENLLDEEYEEELDFPAPERTFFVGLEVKF
ncbi:TonB-dependent receptor [Thermodesulforhabdus norvegica]|nr:TonB-dependent receptor [Thermodesulforhabdus norvegica]